MPASIAAHDSSSLMIVTVKPLRTKLRSLLYTSKLLCHHKLCFTPAVSCRQILYSYLCHLRFIVLLNKMTRRTHQYSVANFTTNEQFLRTRSSRSTSLKGEVDPKLAMRKIMEEQRQNELYHDDKKRQEIILYRKGIHDRAAVPLPPSNSLDVIIYEFNNYTCNNFS